MSHVPLDHAMDPPCRLIKAVFTQSRDRPRAGGTELKLLPVSEGRPGNFGEPDVTLALHDRDLMTGHSAGTGVIAWPRLARVTLSLWLVLFAAELIASMVLCGGRLVFTLDDPYIHLAVADHILSGGYGVNAAEYASPSSSIIWPYLLAITESLHLGAFGPLMMATAAAAASMVAVLRLLESFGLGRDDAPFAYAVAMLSIFAVSAVALPMTGLEHSLHVWVSFVSFAGLVLAALGCAPSWL